MIPPERRLPELVALVDKQAYFVVHAPRQTGKTTVMQALARRLTDEGRYAALWFTCETGRPFDEDVEQVSKAVWLAIEGAAALDLPPELRPPPPLEVTAGGYLQTQLTRWAQACPRPLVLVFDEIDANIGGRLGAVIGSKLRQLAAKHQVLCITHLPQIASYADRHLTVRKTQSGEKTQTSVRVIAGDERVEEIAEMIGGKSITATTRAQAKELVEMARAEARPKPARKRVSHQP